MPHFWDMSATFTDVGPRETMEDVQGPPDRRELTASVSPGRFSSGSRRSPSHTSGLSGTCGQEDIDPLRSVAPSNFYDIQARRCCTVTCHIPNGSIGIEAFVYQGHSYTYFGVFPALLRIPVLLFTSSLDARLTAPSLLLAWIVTGLFASLLLWRTRHLVRGTVPLGWGEAACYGVLAASVTGGSVLLAIASSPSVYNEDMAWSVALTTAALFALLGVLEGPSRRRVLLLGCFVLAINLDRPSTGYACALGALLAAGWLFLARRSPTDRRYALSTALAGLVPLVVAGVIGWAKYRAPIGGYPLQDQVWTQVNAHRRYFLALNGGKPFSLHFLPSTLVAYFQPAGLHLTSTFPFITLPAHYPLAVGKVVLEQTQPTASIVASMPLLFLLACWGVVAAFRPRGSGAISLTRIPLIAGAAGGAGIFLFGFIFNRYSADVLPFLILASAVGLVDICHRIGGRRRAVVIVLASLLVVLALFGVAANLGIAASPVPQWTSAEAKQLPLLPTLNHSWLSVGLRDPRGSASVLGPSQPALRGAGMHWPLSLHRLCVLGLTGAADHALDMDPCGAVESREQDHRTHLQCAASKRSGPPSRYCATAHRRSLWNPWAVAFSISASRTREGRTWPGRTRSDGTSLPTSTSNTGST